MRHKLKSVLRISAAISTLCFSGLLNAQAYLECGKAACSSNVQPWSTSVTGVEDLSLQGKLFDVSFSVAATSTSPFVFSSAAASPGQNLTGVDAGNAISAFYGGLLPPYDGYPIAGDPGPAFITAFAPAGALSGQYFGATTLWDVAETSVGGGGKATRVVGNNGFSNGPPIAESGGLFYTTWTPVVAPEIDPNFALSGVMLLAGGLAVLRGRRPIGVAA